MCGVGAYVLRHAAVSATRVERMLAGLRHRGPDDEGVALVSRDAGSIASFCTRQSVAPLRGRLSMLSPDRPGGDHDVALIHTRYAIVDLSDRAHQPFVSQDGSVVAAFHGEIYNYRELRRDLRAEGVVCRTESDTEVLVEGYRAWRDDVWRRLNGFWAVVLYDGRSRRVVVSRDRMGVAPLYYRETSDGVFFSSAIRPLLQLLPNALAIDHDAVRGFIDHGIKDFDAATCYRDVRSFPPAATLAFSREAQRVHDAQRVWEWRYPAARWTPRDLSLDEAAARTRTALVRAVELRLRADVPVVFELSGGLDSSSIVAAAAALGHESASTYTVSVPERDEEPYARSLRDRYPLRYHVVAGGEDSFADQGAEFASIMEEPYHSPNTFTAWQMRRSMKADGGAVVLSGSGGDETLAGYEYEFWSAAARELRATGRRWHAARHALGMRWGSRARARLTVQEAVGRFRRTVTPTRRTTDSPVGQPTRAARHAAGYDTLAFHDRALFQFEVAHLPYYLRNNDHVTMSVPLETRFPFLDVDVVELGLQLPVEYLYRDGWSKYVLRRAMQPMLPARVVWRRDKMGFPFPLRRFLRRMQPVFAAECRRVTDAGLVDARAIEWSALLERDPVRLWRLVSTGMWLGVA
jgi:asparagine synthase (glutamine-hydrolysing)